MDAMLEVEVVDLFDDLRVPVVWVDIEGMSFNDEVVVGGCEGGEGP